MQIDGSGVLVTGGCSGLGEATVRRLHAAGASVVIADLADERGHALEAELGERARFVCSDVTVADDVRHAVREAAAFGHDGLRLAVACAGVAAEERLVSEDGPASLERFDRVFAVNVTGTFNVLRLAAEAMAANAPSDPDGERGVIVTTASSMAFDGTHATVAYAGSKAAVAGMTLPAARDLAAYGIRVASIAPGWFETAMTAARPGAPPAPLHLVPFPARTGQPSEYAALAEHIAANPMLNGTVIRLDAGARYVSDEAALRGL
jgi:NAD(P)-dependent dehydrogenase (short-subunit alcohol dehydrogenase family)